MAGGFQISMAVSVKAYWMPVLVHWFLRGTYWVFLSQSLLYDNLRSMIFNVRTQSSASKTAAEGLSPRHDPTPLHTQALSSTCGAAVRTSWLDGFHIGLGPLYRQADLKRTMTCLILATLSLQTVESHLRIGWC